MKHQFHVSGSSASFLSAKNVKHRLGIGSHAQSAQRNSTRNSGSTGAASVSLGWIFFRSNLGLFPSYQEGFVVDFLKDAPGLGKHGVFFLQRSWFKIGSTSCINTVLRWTVVRIYFSDSCAGLGLVDCSQP